MEAEPGPPFQANMIGRLAGSESFYRQRGSENLIFNVSGVTEFSDWFTLFITHQHGAGGGTVAYALTLNGDFVLRLKSHRFWFGHCEPFFGFSVFLGNNKGAGHSQAND